MSQVGNKPDCAIVHLVMTHRIVSTLLFSLLTLACAGPQVRIETPVVGEGLSQNRVHRVARCNRREIRDCYEERLLEQPDVAGRIVVRFYVNHDGAVDMFLVEDRSLGDIELAECIANVINNWSFPEPDGGRVMVNLPISLTPQASHQ